MEKQFSSLIESLKYHAQTNGDKLAVVDPKNRLSYGELWSKVKSFAAYLVNECGVKKGDVVIARAAQQVWYPIVYFAIHLAGGVTLGLEKNVSADTIKYLCELTECKALLSLNPEMPEAVREGMSYFCTKNVMDVADNYPECELPMPDPDAVADIMFTTGTTGNSKGVCIAHKSLVRNAAKLLVGFGFRKTTAIVVPGPLNHGGALRKLHATVLNASTMYILNGMLSLNEFFRALDSKLGSMACCLPPAAIRVILALTGDRIAQYADIIDFIESGSALLSETDRVTLGDYLPNTRIIIQYGSTECGGLTVYDCNHERGLPTCAGREMAGCKVYIIDDDGNFIQDKPGQIGIIASHSDAQMEFYYKAPEMTNQVLRNGIVYTSDMGYFDEQGRLFVTGRKDDVINVGGLKVAPGEVEDCALHYPGIADCVCVAAKDKVLEYVPHLYVALTEGAKLNTVQFIEYLSGRLEAYKVPKQIKVVDKVNRTFNGKIDRKSYR